MCVKLTRSRFKGGIFRRFFRRRPGAKRTYILLVFYFNWKRSNYDVKIDVPVYLRCLASIVVVRKTQKRRPSLNARLTWVMKGGGKQKGGRL